MPFVGLSPAFLDKRTIDHRAAALNLGIQIRIFKGTTYYFFGVSSHNPSGIIQLTRRAGLLASSFSHSHLPVGNNRPIFSQYGSRPSSPTPATAGRSNNLNLDLEYLIVTSQPHRHSTLCNWLEWSQPKHERPLPRCAMVEFRYPGYGYSGSPVVRECSCPPSTYGRHVEHSECARVLAKSQEFVDAGSEEALAVRTSLE